MVIPFDMAGLPNYGESLNDNLNDYVMSLLGQAHILAVSQPVKGPDNQYGSLFAQQPKWLLDFLAGKDKGEDLAQAIYKATNHEANCIIPYSFGGITLKWPAWRYSNQDNESGSAFGHSAGVGILSFEMFRGPSSSHHLYRDLGDGHYFYVVSHGHHDPHTGLESKSRLKQFPYSIIPNRAYEDAVIGSNDKISRYDDYLNTACVTVPNPHLSKEAFMNIVYPSYDNPCSRATLENSSESPIVNELVDETKYTPEQDFSSELSDAKLPFAIRSLMSKQFDTDRKVDKQTLGRDEQPLDPNFHIFRMVNMEAIRTHPDMAAANIIGMSGGKYGHLQAWKLIQAYLGGGQKYSDGVGGGMSASQYYSVLSNVNPNANFPKGTPDYVGLSIATGKSSFASTPVTKLKKLAPFQQNLSGYMYARQYYYETLLFDYYADNSKFFSGKFDVTGRTGIEYGVRLVWLDKRRHYVWEGYVDGVEHHFYYNSNQPWTTTISVERMLPFTPEEAEGDWRDTTTGKKVHRSPVYFSNQPIQAHLNRYGDYVPNKNSYIHGNFSKRFSGGFWGRQARFNGGFFGEQTLASMIDQANEREKAYMSHFLNTGGGASPSKANPDTTGNSDIIAYGKKYLGLKYGGHAAGAEDIGAGKPKSKCSPTDCSGFVWGVLKHCGYKVTSTPFTTHAGEGPCMTRISAREAGPGDVGIENKGYGHTLFIQEKYRGASTRTLEEGGTALNVNQEKLKPYAYSGPLSDWTWYRPKKK